MKTKDLWWSDLDAKWTPRAPNCVVWTPEGLRSRIAYYPMLTCAVVSYLRNGRFQRDDSPSSLPAPGLRR
jgi:hypothetical protein